MGFTEYLKIPWVVLWFALLGGGQVRTQLQEAVEIILAFYTCHQVTGAWPWPGMNYLARVASILFLQNEDKNAHSHAKDKEMTCVDKHFCPRGHKQLFDTHATRFWVKREPSSIWWVPWEMHPSTKGSWSMRCPLEFHLPEWQQWASWTVMFLAASTLHLTARGLQYYLWCELQAWAKPPESRGGGRKHCKSWGKFCCLLKWWQFAEHLSSTGYLGSNCGFVLQGFWPRVTGRGLFLQ